MTGDGSAASIDDAGLAGLHTHDCWDDGTHDECREIVTAVLLGLLEAGYRVVPGV